MQIYQHQHHDISYTNKQQNMYNFSKNDNKKIMKKYRHRIKLLLMNFEFIISLTNDLMK